MTRSLLAVVLAGLVLAACTGGSSPAPADPSPAPTTVPPEPETPNPAPTGPGSAAEALAHLCTLPQPKGEPDPTVPAEGPTPPAI